MLATQDRIDVDRYLEHTEEAAESAAEQLVDVLAAREDVLPRTTLHHDIERHLEKVLAARELRLLKHIYGDSHKVSKAINARRVWREQRAIAGTASQREEAARREQTAREKLAAEAPALDEQLAKLRARRDALDNELSAATRDRERRAAAVEKMREHVPERVRRNVEKECAQIKSTLNPRIAQLQLVAALPAAKAELEQLQRERAAALATAKQALDFYDAD